MAGGLSQLPRQLPLLRAEPVDLLEAFGLVAGPGIGQGQGGELLSHGDQLRHERCSSGIAAVAG